MRKDFVTFLSPGTFVHEQTTKPIDKWDIPAACEMSTSIVERYGARPFCFYFTTVLTAEPVPDGEGGTLEVCPKEVARSGTHFLGGTVLTIHDVEARARPGDEILASNMRFNWPVVVETSNGFRSVNPFVQDDVIVDAAGHIVERGDTPERVRMRSSVLSTP